MLSTISVHSLTLVNDHCWQCYNRRLANILLYACAAFQSDKQRKAGSTDMPIPNARTDALCLARAKFCRASDRRQYLFESFLHANSFITKQSAVVCRCQTLAHLLCLSARHSTACIPSVSISSFSRISFLPTIIPNDDNYYNYVFFSQQIRP